MPDVRPVLLDVTSDASVADLAGTLSSQLPNGLYGLVNNAGIGLPSPVELTTPEEFHDLLDVNTVAPLRMIQQCLPLLRLGGGRIVNMSSLNGSVASPMVGAYSASKFALEAVSDALRVELRPWRIPISLVAPGQVATPIFDKSQEALQRRREMVPAELREGYDEMFERAGLLNEWGANSPTSPEKVAAVVLRALNSKYPRARYYIGWDSFGMRLLNALAPQFLVDRLSARIVGTLNPLKAFRRVGDKARRDSV
jgi:NAD(P)-dependent dehydrogenase (short-subunit alcohol dehydrogenase family)